jgi:YD repeat-containing protein
MPVWIWRSHTARTLEISTAYVLSHRRGGKEDSTSSQQALRRLMFWKREDGGSSFGGDANQLLDVSNPDEATSQTYDSVSRLSIAFTPIYSQD